MNINLIAYLLIFTCLALLSNCQFKSSQTNSCIQQKIALMEAASSNQNNKEVWRYDYKGVEVYFIPSSGGDQMSELYDKDCQRICQPDGGILGTGDGRCSDFFTVRKNGKLLWESK